MKAIARIAKLKGGSLSASEQHTSRDRDTPNADSTKNNQRLIDAEQRLTLEQQIRQRIGNQRIRKDAVLCVEMLLSVSPEYFRPTNSSRAGYWEEERLERFQWAVQQWLSDTYGDLILRAELHLDEATPHIHAYVIPLDEKGKLNCKAIFGGRDKLRQFQDSYAQALKLLGVERGIRGSRATHTAIQDYYAAVTQEPDLSLDAETIHHQLHDRCRALKERDELERTARALERENIELRSQLQHHQQLLESYSAKSTHLSLERVAYELGLNADLQHQHIWRDADYEIHISDRKFYEWQTMKGGSGAIDLVMVVQQCDFQRAVLWLRDRFGESPALQAIADQTQELFRAEPQQHFILPIAQEQYWQPVRNYLIQKMKFPATWIDRLHQQKLIYTDVAHQIVFVNRDLRTGAVIGTARYCLETESQINSEGAIIGFYIKAGGKQNEKPQRLVLVDSPIEVVAKGILEYPQKARSLYLAVNRSTTIPTELQHFSEVVLAYSKSEYGTMLADQLSSESIVVIQEFPKTETWHQDLVEMLKQLGERSQPVSPQFQKSHNFSTGMNY